MKYEKEINDIMESIRLCPSDFIATLVFMMEIELYERQEPFTLFEEKGEVPARPKLTIVKTED